MQHEITAGNGFGPRSASGEVGRHEVQGVATHHSGGREHRPDVGLSPEGSYSRAHETSLYEELEDAVSGNREPPVTSTVRRAVVSSSAWCSPLLPGGNGSGRLFADAFARVGIASLRYDKWASGPMRWKTSPCSAER
ncbi:hypothetical protein GCM10009628_13890 [Paeniglutamicibacter kerguelensis]|uniref:Uncharacterized protein n=1 Tax=Paeniglutamicibacter kerguelensis TaxID=254788 RepID=A0ABS4XBZ3_9MICC|nr:hypothetical protein [Paeniglutamicibacter kerguelensis]